MSNSIAKLSLLVSWFSVPLSTLGSYLQIQTPRFYDRLTYIQSQYDDLPGAGLWLLYCWPCLGFMYLIITLFITIGMITMWAIARRKSLLTQIISLTIGLGLWLVLLKTLVSVWQEISWGFYVLASGQLLLAIGLIGSLAALEKIYRQQT